MWYKVVYADKRLTEHKLCAVIQWIEHEVELFQDFASVACSRCGSTMAQYNGVKGALDSS